MFWPCKTYQLLLCNKITFIPSSTFVDLFETNYMNFLLLVFSDSVCGHVIPPPHLPTHPSPHQVLSFSFFLSCSSPVETKTLKCSVQAFSYYTKLMLVVNMFVCGTKWSVEQQSACSSRIYKQKGTH